MDFRWNQWNIEHIAEHDIRPEQAEFVVEHSSRQWHTMVGDGKHRVWGQGPTGEYLQVIFVESPLGVLFVIHARPLTDAEKRRFRRRMR